MSELFAIGAPTSTLVVTLFTISSGLLLLFAIGIWLSADHRRLMKPITAMMALNAIDALLLWNFFPMHMRGVEPTFTDTMHGLLAVDPFLLATIVLAALAFRGPFRVYTIISLSSRRYAPSARSGTCRCSSPTSPRHGWVRWNAPDNTPQTCGTQCWR